jgi:hypothetical protein
MMRQTARRLGHQLIKEPLPNVEHHTIARGQKTFGNVMSDINKEAAIAAVGALGTVFVLFSNAAPDVVKSNGAIEKGA